ncbi:MAG: hypothetical protein ACREMN_14435 [Gemmatimonadales bacterium]
MPPFGRRAFRCAVMLLGAAMPASPAVAQLISIKTVPIAQGDQFLIFPSDNLGLGGVSIALADSLLDPFVNPALGSRVAGARFFSAPTVYSVSHGTGGGRSLPVAALARHGNWYGGLALALQQVEPSRPPDQGGVIFSPLPQVDDPRLIPADGRAHGNRYAFAMIGTAFPGRRLSIGASAFWTGLRAVDGVDLLYADSRRVEQQGHALDLRLGVLKDWPGERGHRSLQALLLHNRFAADHEVIYADRFWDPASELFRERARVEENHERTNTWGLQVKYEMPIGADGWRIGWLGTFNRASHPKIPEYELANVPVIPRDPGYSSAFNFGVGVSRVRGAATFGADLIYEPIRSYTWADAAAPLVIAAGDTLAAGAKTVENWFSFSNVLLRFGVGRDIALNGLGKAVGLQFGLIVRSTHYDLEQIDHVVRAERSLTTGWLEWTPTWGLSLRFPEFELRYRGRVTHGAGRPGVQAVFGPVNEMRLAGATILAAPSGPLMLTDVSTTTHQISLSLPLH